MKVQCDFCKKSFEIKTKATVVGCDPEGACKMVQIVGE